MMRCRIVYRRRTITHGPGRGGERRVYSWSQGESLRGDFAGKRIEGEQVTLTCERRYFCWLLIAAIVPGLGLLPLANADVFYRTTGEYGEQSFSDINSPGATRLEVHAPSVDRARIAEQRAMVEQQWMVANALEESRLARESVAAKRLAARKKGVVTVAAPTSGVYPGRYFLPQPRSPGHRKRRHHQRKDEPAIQGVPAEHVFRPGYPGIASRSDSHRGGAAAIRGQQRTLHSRLPTSHRRNR